jgi:uncharacterized protein (TIGR03083 family)
MRLSPGLRTRAEQRRCAPRHRSGEFTSGETVKRCVGVGFAIGVLALISVTTELDTGRLIALPWNGPTLKIGSMAISDYPLSAIPWPTALDWSAAELRGYLVAAADPAVQRVRTKCQPWTVRDLTAHLGATFHRFADQLGKAKAGDLTAPFGPGDLSRENLRAVELFRGDPLQALEQQASRFLREARCSQAGQLMGHQRGPVPVGLQVMWGLGELAVHRDDLADATGSSYRPSDLIVAALVAMKQAIDGFRAGDDQWLDYLRSTGRHTAAAS